MLIVSGHQPAYLPWLGLLHKAKVCDVFVFMDDVQYLENDWNNRNRIKVGPDSAAWLTVPVRLGASGSRKLRDIRIDTSQRWQDRHLLALRKAYGKASYFKDYFPFFEDLYTSRHWESLSELNLAILRQLFSWFGIGCRLVIASEEGFKGRKAGLVLEHGLRFQADLVFAGALGRDYIDPAMFARHGLTVCFQDYRHPEYAQRFGAFLPRMSSVDILFNHGPAAADLTFAGNLTREDLAACLLP